MGKLNLRLPDGTWLPVADPINPLRLRMPDGTWQAIGNGGGRPLKLRMPDKTWKIISTGGIGHLITGIVSRLNGNPGVGKTVMLVGGPVFPAPTVTDSEGRYSFPDLPYGTYEILVYPTAHTFIDSTVSLTPASPGAEVDFILPAGQHTITEQFPGGSFAVRPGWGSSYGDGDNAFEAAFPVDTLAASSQNYVDFGTQGTSKNDLVSWMAVPLNRMLELADLKARDELDNGVLQAINLNFSFSGSSYVYNGFSSEPYDDGEAILTYLGPAGYDPRADVSWDPFGTGPRVDNMPVVRDREFAREEGIPVWEGQITQPGVPPGGTSRWVVTEPMPLNYPFESALFELYTSEAEEPPSGQQVSMFVSADVTVDFVYTYG